MTLPTAIAVTLLRVLFAGIPSAVLGSLTALSMTLEAGLVVGGIVFLVVWRLSAPVDLSKRVH